MLIQAVDRLRSPVEIDSRLMPVVAAIGVLAYLAGLSVLRPAQAKSLNIAIASLLIVVVIIPRAW